MITRAQDTGGKDRRRYKLVSGDCKYYRAASPSPTSATPSRISPSPAILRPVKASLKNRENGEKTGTHHTLDLFKSQAPY